MAGMVATPGKTGPSGGRQQQRTLRRRTWEGSPWPWRRQRELHFSLIPCNWWLSRRCGATGSPGRCGATGSPGRCEAGILGQGKSSPSHDGGCGTSRYSPSAGGGGRGEQSTALETEPAGIHPLLVEVAAAEAAPAALLLLVEAVDVAETEAAGILPLLLEAWALYARAPPLWALDARALPPSGRWVLALPPFWALGARAPPIWALGARTPPFWALGARAPPLLGAVCLRSPPSGCSHSTSSYCVGHMANVCPYAPQPGHNSATRFTIIHLPAILLLSFFSPKTNKNHYSGKKKNKKRPFLSWSGCWRRCLSHAEHHMWQDGLQW
ncbi:UNVERIFIED_CONTAM: hypothetical protein FKN15_035133 [Acipenser sinensis]